MVLFDCIINTILYLWKYKIKATKLLFGRKILHANFKREISRKYDFNLALFGKDYKDNKETHKKKLFLILFNSFFLIIDFYFFAFFMYNSNVPI